MAENKGLTRSRYSLLTGRYPYRAPKAFVDALLPKDPAHEGLHLPKDGTTIARVLTALEQLKLEQGTIVIFMCDNGADYRYGGSNKPYRAAQKQFI